MALAETIAPFLWGAGGSKKTPEQVAREREIAAALMQGGMDYSPVDHWLQGAARASQGLVGGLKDTWANEAETAGREGFQSQWDSVFGGGQTASIDPVAAALMPQTASDATAALAAVPSGDNAGYIRAGLVQRGLPEHVADAFLMNMQDESGLNPGINEASPTVPGSRGGFGLYQLTGPRRVAYEQYAQQLGVDPSNVDAQLDFMMKELQGPEANAYQSILAAPDTGSAAAAIVNDFLRPAEEHRARRVAQYTGGAPMQTAQAGGQPSIQELIGLASDPWANESQQQILQALMGQQLQQQDPAYQLDLALKQAQLDAANAPAGPEYGFTFAPNGTLIRTDETSGSFAPMGQFSVPEEAEPGGPLFDVEGKLRAEYQGQQGYKDYVQQEQAYQRVLDSARDPSPAGDLALIFNYMKVLDPGSVVRESEFATAAASGAFGDRIQAAVQQVTSGERLSPDMRRDFVQRAGDLFSGATSLYSDMNERYSGLAGQYGADPARIVRPGASIGVMSPEFSLDELLGIMPAIPGAPPAGQQSQPPVISQQDYPSLPSGSPFIAADDPTRTVRIKP